MHAWGLVTFFPFAGKHLRVNTKFPSVRGSQKDTNHYIAVVGRYAISCRGKKLPILFI